MPGGLARPATSASVCGAGRVAREAADRRPRPSDTRTRRGGIDRHGEPLPGAIGPVDRISRRAFGRGTRLDRGRDAWWGRHARVAAGSPAFGATRPWRHDVPPWWRPLAG
ncbi:hypothetical protein C1701_11230 [Actinoalloteichus sp. AHMU CJ021]|nr:hypothetical protein C1701_11230 [Actinoalloteichus sp. AHMU CJ021]